MTQPESQSCKGVPEGQTGGPHPLAKPPVPISLLALLPQGQNTSWDERRLPGPFQYQISFLVGSKALIV